MATRSSKRQKTVTTTTDDKSGPTSSQEPEYTLIYWPGIPGRGEHIRLALEVCGVAYTDTAQTGPAGAKAVLSMISPDSPDNNDNETHNNNPPPFAPPILRHGSLILSQTPNILMYLAALHPGVLAPDPASDPVAQWHINALTLTALDGLSNEPHDTHHPIANALYYEDQKAEAVRKAADYRDVRLPKFLAYFERVLRSNNSNNNANNGDGGGHGEWLYGTHMTYADIVLFHTLDGVSYAFPKCVARLRQGEGGATAAVWALYERVKAQDRVAEYLKSERRQKYGMGIYRYYEELDE